MLLLTSELFVFLFDFVIFVWAFALNIAPLCAMVYTYNLHVLLPLCSIILFPLMNVCMGCHIMAKKGE